MKNKSSEVLPASKIKIIIVTPAVLPQWSDTEVFSRLQRLSVR